MDVEVKVGRDTDIQKNINAHTSSVSADHAHQFF